MALSRAGKKRIILAVSVLALFGFAASIYGWRKIQLSHNMSSWRSTGLNAYEHGDYDAAISPLSRFVTHDTTDIEVLLAFADARRTLPLDNAAHLKQAINLTQIAINLEPQSLRAHHILLELYRSIGYSTEARDAAQSVLELDPTDRNAHETIVQSFFAAGRNADAARASLNMAKAIPDDINAQRVSLEYLIAASYPQDELQDFVDARAEKFSSTLGYRIMQAQLATMQLSLSDPNTPALESKIESIKTMLIQATTIPASNAQEVKDLMRFLDVFAPDTADSVLASYMNDPTLAEPLTLYSALRDFKHNNRSAAAQVIEQNTPDLDSASPEALFWIVLGNTENAADASKRLHARTDDNAQQWIALCDAYTALEMNDASTALVRLSSTSLIVDPEMLILQDIARAQAKLALGEAAFATRLLERILQKDPSWQVANITLVEAYLALQRPLDARRIIRSMRNLVPLDANLLLHTELAIDLARFERPNPTSKNSYETFSALLEAQPDTISLLPWTARAALATGHNDEALELVDRILATKTLPDISQLALLAHELKRVDVDRAGAVLAKAQAQSHSPLASLEQAKLANRTDGPAAGRAILEQAIKQAQTDERPTYRLMLTSYLDAVDAPDAASTMLALSADFPDNIQIQQHILNAHAVWLEPAALEPVIDRLRKLTGEDGTQWAIYAARRQLAMIDPKSSTASADTSGVVRSLARVLRDDPTNSQALSVAADAAEQLGDLNRATEYRMRAAASNPASASLQIAAIEALDKAGRFDEAQQCCRMLAGIPLENAQAIINRADILERHGLAKLARHDIELLAKAGAPGPRVRLATQFYQDGQVNKADAMVEQVLNDAKASPKIMSQVLYERIAAYYRDSGRENQGMALLKALPSESELGKRDEIIAHYLFQSVNTHEQAAALEAFAKKSYNGYVWAAAAQGYMRLNDFDTAAALVKEGLGRAPYSAPLASLNRMLSARDTGDPLTMLASLQTALSLRPSLQAQSIATLLDQRLTNRIDNPTLITELELRTQSPSASWEAWQGYIVALESVNDRDNARKAILRSLDVFSTSPEIASFAAVGLDRMGFPRDSLLAAQNWLSRTNGASFEAARMVAMGMLNLGRSADAIKTLAPWRADMLKNWQQDPQAVLAMGVALVQTNAVDQAHEMLWPLTDQPSGIAIYLGVNNSIKDTTQRRAWLDRISPKAVEKSPAVDIYNLANAWIDLGKQTGNDADLRQARNIIEPKLAQAGSSPEFYLLVAAAAVHDALNDLDLAADFYTKAVAQVPNNPDLHNNFAYLLFKKDSDLDQALSHASQAVELADRAGLPIFRRRSYLDTKAQILLKMGKARQSADIYRGILAEDPSWPTGIIGLSESLKSLGDADAARSELGQIPPQIALPKDLHARVTALENALDN